jgi:hypothetical protein
MEIWENSCCLAPGVAIDLTRTSGFVKYCWFDGSLTTLWFDAGVAAVTVAGDSGVGRRWWG